MIFLLSVLLVHSLEDELAQAGHIKDEQIEELKQVSEENSQLRQAEYEKKVNTFR